MKKLFGLTAGFAMVGLALVILGPGLALALPNPPALLNTTWEGKYEIAYNTGFNTTGTMTMTITNVSGALFRGNVTNLSGPLPIGQPTPFSGIVLDGELRMTAVGDVISARLIYDNTGTTPVWKVRGYWQTTFVGGPGDPYRPNTGWFLLKKK